MQRLTFQAVDLVIVATDKFAVDLAFDLFETFDQRREFRVDRTPVHLSINRIEFVFDAIDKLVLRFHSLELIFQTMVLAGRLFQQVFPTTVDGRRRRRSILGIILFQLFNIVGDQLDVIAKNAELGDGQFDLLHVLAVGRVVDQQGEFRRARVQRTRNIGNDIANTILTKGGFVDESFAEREKNRMSEARRSIDRDLCAYCSCI